MSKKKAPVPILAYDPLDRTGSLKEIGGSEFDNWNNLLANQACSSLWVKHSDPATREKQYGATLAALMGIGPRDELEGMIAAQLIAAHNAAMECYRRAMLAEQSIEGRKDNLNQANKLSRSYASLVEAFNRHRGKGQQKVTVEHVHVHSGGQAIVGNVHGQGGGDTHRIEDQSHAKQIADARQPPMHGPNPKGEPVPITSHE